MTFTSSHSSTLKNSQLDEYKTLEKTHYSHEFKEPDNTQCSPALSSTLSLDRDSPGESPYLMTTETGHLEALKTLRNTPTPKNGVYLGFAFEFNYHVLAKRAVQKAFICDINPRMHTLYNWIAQTIVTTPDRQEFLQKFEKELDAHADYYLGFPPTTREAIERFTSLKWSWLYTDKNYGQIRQLYRDGKIEHRYLDVTDKTGKFQELGNWA